jgi:radical SAM protein with 4Fe4S-binding SPASM domain
MYTSSATPLPKHLWFEPTNVCNARCPLCPTGAGQLSRPQAFLDFGLYQRVVEEVRPDTIHFWNMGEPFLHSQIFEMFRFAADRGVMTQVSTNGFVFYQPENIPKLLDSGLHKLILSLDGIDAQTFNQYRVGVDFSKVIQGLRLLLQQRPFDLEVVWQFIVMRHNEHQVEQAQAIARGLGIPFSLKSVNLDLLPEQADADSHLPNNPQFSRYEKEEETLTLKNQNNPCYFVQTTLMINADGSVTPCAFDPQGLLKLGDVNLQSVAEIWNGEPMQTLRHQLGQERQLLNPCKNCSVGAPKAVSLNL